MQQGVGREEFVVPYEWDYRSYFPLVLIHKLIFCGSFKSCMIFRLLLRLMGLLHFLTYDHNKFIFSDLQVMGLCTTAGQTQDFSYKCLS